MNQKREIDILLQEMIDHNASDLHLQHGAKISFRIDTEIEQIGSKLGDYISGDDIFQVLIPALDKNEQHHFRREGSVDFSYALGDVRFRGSLIHGNGHPSCVLRIINSEIIPLEKLGLPPVVKTFADSSWGVVLVTGPTGSGKSTTLASMVDYINTNKKMKIYTAEQPLEYIHQNKKSIIMQRQVPNDTPTFAQSMIDALRQDPDVILVGEMRDDDTISSAMTSAETGHLVMSTLHTNSAPETIRRILNEYPVSEHDKIRGQLASNLRGVVSQRLFKNPNGGKTALFEIMVMDEDIRTLIRENRIDDIYSVMKEKPEAGNMLMIDSLAKAQAKGLVGKHIKW